MQAMVKIGFRTSIRDGNHAGNYNDHEVMNLGGSTPFAVQTLTMHILLRGAKFTSEEYILIF